MSDIPEVRELEAQVSLAIQVEAFTGSAIGQMFVKRVESERAAALERLADADAEDPKAIRAIQNEIRVIDTVQQYLADTLIAAKASLARLEQFDQGD